VRAQPDDRKVESVWVRAEYREYAVQMLVSFVIALDWFGLVFLRLGSGLAKAHNWKLSDKKARPTDRSCTRATSKGFFSSHSESEVRNQLKTWFRSLRFMQLVTETITVTQGLTSGDASDS
jgi:hypothetical protein